MFCSDYSAGFFYRFGEDDASLLLEEKMWARMQRERNQRSRSVGMLNLGDGEGLSDLLTHKGRALGTNYQDDTQSDEDDNLNAEVVDRLHFGGGMKDAHQPHQVGNIDR